MIALLDTSVLVAAGSTTETTPELTGFEDIMVSSLSWSELTMGVNAAGSVQTYRERDARLRLLRATFGEGLPYDDECTEGYARILARVTAGRGEPKARRLDRMIAATALTHGMTLVTRDLADAAVLAGLVDVQRR